MITNRCVQNLFLKLSKQKATYMNYSTFEYGHLSSNVNEVVLPYNNVLQNLDNLEGKALFREITYYQMKENNIPNGTVQTQ